MNNDQINISSLQAGDYTMEIEYKISVPSSYKEYIDSLARKYNISLTPRELGILSLAPTV